MSGKISRLCGYWPDKPRDTLHVYMSEQGRKSPSLEERRAFKFNMLAQGAMSNGASRVYFTVCPQCPVEEHCIPIRINLSAYDPLASSSRIHRAKRFLETVDIETIPSGYDAEAAALFELYVRNRHPQKYASSRFTTEDYHLMVNELAWIVNARDKKSGALVASIYLDQHGDNFCGEYLTYMPTDPEFLKMSPGISMLHVILSQLKTLYPNGFIYTGGWSSKIRTLNYKQETSGTELYRDSRWVSIAEELSSEGQSPTVLRDTHGPQSWLP